jgi:hypothetical protein
MRPSDDRSMTAARILLDAWLALVSLSLAGVTGIVLAYVLVSVATLVAAARRTSGQAARLAPLAGRLGENDLADIDEALERILAEEGGSLHGLPGVSAASSRQ